MIAHDQAKSMVLNKSIFAHHVANKLYTEYVWCLA